MAQAQQATTAPEALTPEALTDDSLLDLGTELGAEFARDAAARDLDRSLPHAELARLKASGFAAARIGADYGGAGVSFTAMAQALQAVAAGDPNIAQAIQPHLNFLDVIALYASPSQKADFYARVLRGELITNAFAERGGTRVGEVNVALTPSGQGYRLTGRKFYCTGSLYAENLFVLCRTTDGVRAIAVLPVDRPGLQIDDDWDGMGQRTTASGTAIFTDVEVAAHEVILQPQFLDWRSFAGASAQIYHAAIDVGIAEAALRDILPFVRDKARPAVEAGVSRQAEDPYVLHLAGELSLHLHQAEAMLERGGRLLDRASRAQLAGGTDPDRLEDLLSRASIAVAEAKASAQNAALFITQSIYGLAGASATLRPDNFDRHWRNARTHTTHDPVSYKYRAIGDFLINGRRPPITTKI